MTPAVNKRMRVALVTQLVMNACQGNTTEGYRCDFNNPTMLKSWSTSVLKVSREMCSDAFKGKLGSKFTATVTCCWIKTTLYYC